jgi:dipeptidyl aminopeptidase/acylaminoacyl peptidase
MKTKTLGVLVLMLALVITVQSAPPGAEDFSHEAAFKDLQLSPDGTMLSYAETIKGEHRMYIMDLASGTKFGMELLGLDKAYTQQTHSFWANNQRFVYYVPRTRTYTAIDRDGRNARPNIRGGALVHRFHEDRAGRALMTGVELASGQGMGRNVQFYYSDRPYVHMVNFGQTSGIGRGMDDSLTVSPVLRVVENPGSVLEWFATPDGRIKAAKEIKGTKYRTLYREADRADWGSLPGLDWADPQAYPLGFAADGGTLYVGRLTPEDTWGVYPYDLKTRLLGEPLIAHQKYDIVHPAFTATSNGVALQGLIYSPKERALLGIRYHTDYPRIFWLDEGLGEVQTSLDQTLSKRINSVISLSDDLQRLIVQSWNAQDPGTYYLFDRKTQKLEKLLSRMPWIDSAAMADMLAIRFRARDGTLVSGYITLPPDKGRTNLPLIVMPHNRTHGRHTWGFDPFVQFLATRGYAVLEVDHRGSAGYGEKFRHVADGHALQVAVSDGADGVQWAIKQKIADPARIAILGQGNLAGANAYMSLVMEPTVYRCGLVGSGTSDWSRIFDRSRLMPDEYAAWVEKFGDPALPAGAAALRDISALHHAAGIKVPVLIMHDKLNFNPDWLYNQSRDMAATLQQAGTTVEFIDKYDEPYGYLMMAKYMNDTMAFLTRYMPAE